MLLRCLLFVVGLVVSLNVVAESFSLSARSGEFNPKPLGSLSPRGTLSASIQITKFDPSKGWPSAAYVGFFQGKNRDNSVQFVIIRNRETDPYVVAGYRIIEGGQEVKVATLGNPSLDAKAHVDMSIDSGQVTLKFPSRAPIMFRTKLGDVSPYASVSSGAAVFSVGP
jgi:hypothetical protein